MAYKYIYILEDSVDIRDILTIVFEEEGYIVNSFLNISEFNIGLTEKTPDVFLLDVMLPDGNGLDVCNRLKSDLITSRIPVLMMTASSGIEQMIKQSGADCFIRKPFDIYNVVKLVSELTP